MSSNKSRPGKNRTALQPQRSHGKLRVAALLEAGAVVIAKKGYQAATMAEIAAKAGAPIGSLYRFFPNKEILADALIQNFCGLVDEAFDQINSRIKTLSLTELIDAFLSMMAGFRAERMAIRALLEAHADWSAKRIQFRHSMIRHIAETLRLRCPRLDAKSAESMAVIVLYQMKMVNAWNAEIKAEVLPGALAELREMMRLYLATKLKALR